MGLFIVVMPSVYMVRAYLPAALPERRGTVRSLVGLPLMVLSAVQTSIYTGLEPIQAGPWPS